MCIVPHCSTLYGRTRSDTLFEARGCRSNALKESKRLIMSSDHVLAKLGYYIFDVSAKLCVFRF